VKKTYGLNSDGCWISAYQKDHLPKEWTGIKQNILVLEGIEIWLKELLEKYDVNDVRDIWNKYLDSWLTWERASGCRHLVLIGTDITKGIVPIEAEDRSWRDVAGWAFQDTAAKASRVDVIWYGLNKTIK